MSESEIARKLGLRERKVRKFVEGLDRSKLPAADLVKAAVSGDDVDLFSPKSVKRPWNLLIFLGITLLAFAIRLIYLNQIKDSPFFVPFYRGLDDYLYDAWGQNIAQGNLIGPDVFYGLPLYPYFLGFIYWFLGHSIFIAKFAQFLIGSVSCGLMFLIGQKVFNRYVGIIAGVIMALFSSAIFFEGFLTSAFLAIFLNAVLMLTLFSAVEKPSAFKWIAAGLLAGLSALANASILIFAVLVIAWMVFTARATSGSRRYLYAAVFFAAILLAVSPATIHNYLAAKEFVPITAHGGITFYAGNNPLSDGTYKLPPELGTNVEDTRKNARLIAERVLKRPLTAKQVSDFWFGQARSFMRSEPARYAGLLLSKAVMFWNAYEIPDILPMSFYRRYAPLLGMPLFGFTLLSPLALLGVILCLKHVKRAEIQLIFMFSGSVFISTLIYFVNSRYRLIAVPYLAVFAGAAVWYTAEAVRALSTRRILTVFAVFAALFVATNIQVVKHSQAQAHNNLGIILKQKGLFDEAAAEYRTAIELQPGYASPYFNLGLLYQEQGDDVQAIEYFQKVLKVNPNMARAYAMLGYSYLKTGDVNKAREHWERSLELDPDQPDVRQALSRAR